MTYEEFVVNPLAENADWLSFLLILFVGASVVGILDGFDRRKNRVRKGGTLMAIVSGMVLVGSVVGVISLLGARTTTNDQNRTVAENNLKQKYDISSVLWGESNTDPRSFDPSGKITVQDQNNNILKFRYKIDEKTREPYLLNDPDFTQVKSNDLLRNQSGK